MSFFYMVALAIANKQRQEKLPRSVKKIILIRMTYKGFDCKMPKLSIMIH